MTAPGCANCGGRALRHLCAECEAKATPAPTPDRDQEKPAPRERFGSKTEARHWADFIVPALASGDLIHAEPGALKVRLADGCWYTPDVLAVGRDGRVWLIEVKGAYIREDALVKFKVAAEHNAWARWTMRQWKNNRWGAIHDFA